MAQVHGNPDEIRAFAQMLEAFSRETRERLDAVHGRLRDMGGSTWNDSRFHEYLELFEQVSTMIRAGLEQVDTEHMQHLYKLAERLDEYENA